MRRDLSRAAILVFLAACGHAATAGPPASALRRPLSVRLEWPDGAPYKAGARWSMVGRCAAGETFAIETNGHVAGGRWMVRWPDGCSTDVMDVELSVFVTWLGCDSPPRFHEMVREGREVRLRIPRCDDGVARE